jgi:hypothetical protein
MSSAKLAAACALIALALSACGTSHKPVAGATHVTTVHTGRGVVDDPRTKHVKCLRQAHIPAVEVGQTGIQVGQPQIGPTVRFEPTPGAAQHAQISGSAQGAEVIGSALLYPNRASDRQLQVIEDCLAVGVQG